MSYMGKIVLAYAASLSIYKGKVLYYIIYKNNGELRYYTGDTMSSAFKNYESGNPSGTDIPELVEAGLAYAR